MGLLKLAIDRQNKVLVDFDGSVTALPPLYETNTQQYRIQIVDPTGNDVSPYEAVDCSGSGLRMVLASLVTGLEGDEIENLLAATYEAGWAYDAINLWYTGEINFNTAEVQAFIDQDAAKGAILEINLITGGTPETVFSHQNGASNVFISANADTGTATAPPVLNPPATIASKAIQNGVGGVTLVDNVVTVAGLGLGSTPSYYLIWVNAPAGSGAIAGNFIIGSATSDGFSFVMTGIPQNNNYTFTYIPVA